MTEAFPLVSVVVASLGRDTLADCLESVVNQTYQRKEIIVVYNSNRLSPDVMALLDKQSAMGAKSIHIAKRLGPARARNVGLTVSTGDIVAFIDDDAIADPDWLASTIRAYGDQRIGGVCGRLVPKAKHPHRLVRFLDELYYGRYHDDPLHILSSANMSIRRDVFVEVGMFNSAIDTYGEDTELALRIMQRGYRIVYEPNAIVKHDSSTGLRNLLWKTYLQSFEAASLGLKYAPPEPGFETRVRTALAAIRRTKSITVLVGLALLYFARRMGRLNGNWKKLRRPRKPQ
jgi:GT2 family glycosyltransferase